jgi:diketogulonate reductase-like aldo/keto reductase
MHKACFYESQLLVPVSLATGTTIYVRHTKPMIGWKGNLCMQENKFIQTAMQSLAIRLPDGRTMPGFGQGTWRMAENSALREREAEALRAGIRLGMTLIDTAEMYGNGGAEEVTAQAIRDFARVELFLVSKVYPHNAGRRQIFKSCEASIKRLGVESLDLYLLHWRGSVPLQETVQCMQKLKADGLIKGWGVSNFDKSDMEELWSAPGGDECCVNQVLYHLGSRGIEFDLLPWMREKGVPVMAYSPLAQAGQLRNGLLRSPSVLEVSCRHGVESGQVLLAFVLRQGMIAIPKASSPEHVAQNAAAALVQLTDEDIALLSREYPAPKTRQPLDMS